MSDAKESPFAEFGKTLDVRAEWRQVLDWRSQQDEWLKRMDDSNDPITQKLRRLKGEGRLDQLGLESRILFDGVALLWAYNAVCRVAGEGVDSKKVDAIQKAFTPIGFPKDALTQLTLEIGEQWEA